MLGVVNGQVLGSAETSTRYWQNHSSVEQGPLVHIFSEKIILSKLAWFRSWFVPFGIARRARSRHKLDVFSFSVPPTIW